MRIASCAPLSPSRPEYQSPRTKTFFKEEEMANPLAQKLLDKTVAPALRYISGAMASPLSPLFREIQHRTNVECVDYIFAEMQTALQFASRFDVITHAMERVALKGIYAEFGVYKGESVNFIASHANQTVHGFDSFEGLREDWKGWGCAKAAST